MVGMYEASFFLGHVHLTLQRYIYYVKYLGMDDLNPAPPYYKVLQDMKYKLTGRVCDVVKQARKDGTWQTSDWRNRGLCLSKT